MLERQIAEWFSGSIGMPLVVDSPLRRAKDRRPARRLLREKMAGQFLPLEQQQAQQLERAQRLLIHAGAHVPYYRDLFRELGFDPRGLRSLADISALPLLTRQMVIDQGHRLLAENAPPKVIHRFFTGGSTGMALRGWQDPSFFHHAEAAAWMSDLAAGRRIGMRTAYLWGGHLDPAPYLGWRGLARKWLRNEFFFDNHFLWAGRLRQYHAGLQALDPGVLVAWASSAAVLAGYLEREGIRPRYPRVALICSGEVLEPEARALIQRVFPAPVFDRYGSREVGLMAYECDHHTGLHLNLANVHLECLGADVYHTPGDIVATQLHNYAMPLIRYQVDDLAVLDARTCTCGRPAPMLARVAGRRMPAFVTLTGQLIEPGHLLTPIRRIPGVLAYQLVQEEVGRLRLLIKTRPDFDAAGLAHTRAYVAEKMGAGCELIIEQVDHIPLPPSGKPQMVVSKVDSAAWFAAHPNG